MEHPKGKARSDLTLAANAAKEAFEEAGVKGEIAPVFANGFAITHLRMAADHRNLGAISPFTPASSNASLAALAAKVRSLLALPSDAPFL